MVVVGRLDQKMPGPIFCPSPALVYRDKLFTYSCISILPSVNATHKQVFVTAIWILLILHV